MIWLEGVAGKKGFNGLVYEEEWTGDVGERAHVISDGLMSGGGSSWLGLKGSAVVFDVNWVGDKGGGAEGVMCDWSKLLNVKMRRYHD